MWPTLMCPSILGRTWTFIFLLSVTSEYLCNWYLLYYCMCFHQINVVIISIHLLIISHYWPVVSIPWEHISSIFSPFFLLCMSYGCLAWNGQITYVAKLSQSHCYRGSTNIVITPRAFDLVWRGLEARRPGSDLTQTSPFQWLPNRLNNRDITFLYP